MKEFTRRIEQIMKTIRHIINMIENERVQECQEKEPKKEEKNSGNFLNKSQNQIKSFFRIGRSQEG